jgi:L-fuconolactonase
MLVILARTLELTGVSRDLDVVFEAFTPGRLTIGSDWSVCILSGDDASTMQVVIDHVQQFQPRAQSGMYSEDCARPIGFTSALLRSSQ